MLLHSFKNSPEYGLDKLLRAEFSTLYVTELRVLLQPNVIELSVLKRNFMAGFRSKIIHHQIITLAELPKTNNKQVIAPLLLKKLIEELQNPIYKGVKPVIVLSNYFVRYLVLDWNEDIKSKQECSLYLKHGFLQHFGDTSKGWHLVEYLPAYGKPAIASGVSRALLQSVEAVFEAANLKIAAIHPLLMLAANQVLHHRKIQKLEKSFWLACVENSRLTLALVEEGDWKLVHNFSVEPDVANQINTLIRRESVIGNTFSTLPIITIGGSDDLISDDHVIKGVNKGQRNETRENDTHQSELKDHKFTQSTQSKWAA